MKEFSIRNSIYVFVCLVLISSVCYYLHNKILDKELNKTVINLQNEIYIWKDKTESLLIADSLRIIDNDKYISTGFYISQDENDSLLLSDLINKHNKILVFKYSELNCQICVDDEIKLLKEYSRITNKNIVIVSSYKSIRDLYLFIRTNQIPNMEIYNMNQNKLGLNIENYNTPFYFTIDTSNIARNVFIPEKSFPERSSLYLKTQLLN